MLFQGDIQPKKQRFFQFILDGMCSLLKSAVAVRTPTFLYSPSDYILQRYIFSNKYVYKKSKSLDLGFSSSFYLKLTEDETTFIPAGFIYYLVTCTQCICIQHKGCWYSWIWEKCFPVCVSKTVAVKWHPFVMGGRGAGVGAYIQFTTFSHALTHASTRTHTRTATQFNILSLQILSINKQLENNNNNNNNKSKVCLRMHRWGGRLCFYLNTLRRILSFMLPVIVMIITLTHH